MTLLEVNALLLLMKRQRLALMQFSKKYRVGEEDIEENYREWWDNLHALDIQADRIEAAMPEFHVEYNIEAQEYCLLPRRTLPYSSCRAVVVSSALEVVR